MSADSVKAQNNFSTKQEFQYQLLSDTDKEIMRSYKAIGMKKMYGREYEGILRIAYLIDEDGKTPVRYTFNEEILKLLVAKGADINLKNREGKTRLDNAVLYGNSDLADILRKNGGKTGEELKAEGK